MLISVFTPTHRVEYLLEAWRSLQAQTHTDFEWLLLPNAKTIADEPDIPEEIRMDPRVRVLPFSISDTIGCLKKLCCYTAAPTAEMFVEFDSDDILTSDALAVIAERRQQSGADFIYSDCIHFLPGGVSEVFAEEHGWESYPWQHNGRGYKALRAFPANARSLCEIYFAPDHVRCWSRKAYFELGGHNGSMLVSDDHDLVSRTYLAGYQFSHIDQPLYLYRRHNANSFVVHNRSLMDYQRDSRPKLIYPLVSEWCRREQLPMVDLSPVFGGQLANGCIALDAPRSNDSGLEIASIGNLTDNSVGCFRAQDVLQHVPSSWLPALMNTIYHKLVPGGWLLSGTPSLTDANGNICGGAFQDPTYRSQWSVNNTWYYTHKHFAGQVPKINCRFQTVFCGIDFPSDWHRKQHVPYMEWDAVALKDQHAPGVKQI